MIKLLLTLIILLSIPEYFRVDDVHRILIAGHSIVRNPPSPGEPYFWDGYWGERATFAHKDVVHQVWGGICARQGFCPDMEIFRAVNTLEVDHIPDKIREYQPDLIVVFWGEAGGTDVPQEAWDALYKPIGESARLVGARAIAVGMWGTRPILDRDEKLRAAAQASGMEYIYIADIQKLRTEEMCAGLQWGVCMHPDDAEMSRIAQRILSASTYLPLIHSENNNTIPKDSVSSGD